MAHSKIVVALLVTVLVTALALVATAVVTIVRGAVATYTVNSTVVSVLLDELLISQGVAADASLCNDTNDCTRDLYQAEGDYCIHLPMPPGTACSDKCYKTANVCDATGLCAGNVGTCGGSCTTGGQCFGYFGPLTDAPADFTNTVNGFPMLLSNGAYCIRSQCAGYVIDLYATSFDRLQLVEGLNYSIDANVSQVKVAYPVAARHDCVDYLDPQYAACIDSYRYMIEPVFQDYAMQTTFGPVVDFFGNASFPYTLSACLYRYKCNSPADSLSPASAGPGDGGGGLLWNEIGSQLVVALRANATAPTPSV